MQWYNKVIPRGDRQKIIKEFTGHHSDALHAYEVTSDMQRQEVSNIIQGQTDQNVRKPTEGKLEISVKSDSEYASPCCCTKQNIKLGETDKISKIIDQLLQSNRCGKTTVRLEIEFDN